MKLRFLVVLCILCVSFSSILSASTSGKNSSESPYDLSSAAFSVSVATPPTITGFSPSSGVVGTSVIISGDDFLGATSVQFNGTSSSFVVNNAQQITATVPGAGTTGLLSVQTPSGTVFSDSNFTLLPKINTFTPTAGPVGTLVQIFGTTLSGTTDVTFNGTSAISFTNISPTQVEATVPVGATTGPIGLTTPDGIAASATNFAVDDPPVGGTVTATPDSGFALFTLFNLQSNGWTDPDLPLEYRFAYRIGANPEISLSSYSVSNTLNTVLPAGDSPNYIVTIIGYIKDSLGVATKDSFDVVVEPGDGDFTVSPTDLDFGELPVDVLDGSTKTDSVKVYNDGVDTLSITSVSSDNAHFTVIPQVATIQASDSLTFLITFHATSAGQHDGRIIFTHNAVGSPDTVSVTGIGNDTTKYRTATYDDWANAIDAKEKRKAIKRKNDKVEYKLNIIAPKAATGFILKLNMPAFGAITSGKAKLDTVHAFSPLDGKVITYVGPVDSADTFQIEGIGTKGSKIKIGVEWQSSPKIIKVTYKDLAQFKKNYPRLPKPNLHNAGEELFPKGFGQVSPYYAAGLQIGIPQGEKNARAVKMFKYSDVLTSLFKITKDDEFYHDFGDPHCLDFFDNKEGDYDTTKPIKSLLKNLSPVKSNNPLFGELLALKLNVAASATNKFPVGLGELTYQDNNDLLNPFNGQLVSTIISKADSMMGCLTITSKTITPTYSDLYNVLFNINVAFSDTVDTISFSTKTRFTGVWAIDEVPYLYKDANIPPVTFISQPGADEYVPSAYRLEQNFPNPFNPTTTIQFLLPEQATVTLKVYNIIGQEVATLLNNESLEDGLQEIQFDATNLSSGVYFYRLVANGIGDEEEGITGQTFVSVKKMILVK